MSVHNRTRKRRKDAYLEKEFVGGTKVPHQIIGVELGEDQMQHFAREATNDGRRQAALWEGQVAQQHGELSGQSRS